jgi:hypothetical protein
VNLGAQRILAFTHELRDVRGERLRLERLVEHDMLDRVVDRLLEARHVRALLLRIEIDEALELRGEELGRRAFGTNSYNLFDASYPNARKAQVSCGTSRLDVLQHCCPWGRHPLEDSQ